MPVHKLWPLSVFTVAAGVCIEHGCLFCAWPRRDGFQRCGHVWSRTLDGWPRNWITAVDEAHGVFLVGNWSVVHHAGRRAAVKHRIEMHTAKSDIRCVEGLELGEPSWSRPASGDRLHNSHVNRIHQAG